MLMTKEQAAEVWCPMQGPIKDEAGFSVIGFARVRNPAKTSMEHSCVADRCAVWQWDSVVYYITGEPAKEIQRHDPPRGYCGLAGRPA